MQRVNLSGIFSTYDVLMSVRVCSIREAYAVLGLEPCAGFGAAKSAFRERVKTLHPDQTPPTQDTLSELADIVAAIRLIETQRPSCLEIEISVFDAEMGAARALKLGEKPVIVRIPAGTENGMELPVVGEEDIRVRIKVRPPKPSYRAPERAAMSEQLDEFVSEFSRPSAVSRLARWIRKSQSAA